MIGAPGWNSNQGAAYVFIRSGSPPVWALQQKLVASDGVAGDYFGTVALSGNTLAVGAPGFFGLRGNSGPSNSLYVFVSGGTTPPWTLQQELTVAPGFGRAVGISGNTIVAESAATLGRVGNCTGNTYVFVRDATTPPWTQQQVLPVGTTCGSVAVSGDTVLVGEPGHFSIIADRPRGTAYVYVRGATTPPWTQQQQLMPSDSSRVTGLAILRR